MTIDRWDKVFKNGPSEICGRQLLMTVIGLLKHTISLQFLEVIWCAFFKGFLPQISLGPFLNTLSHMTKLLF